MSSTTSASWLRKQALRYWAVTLLALLIAGCRDMPMHGHGAPVAVEASPPPPPPPPPPPIVVGQASPVPAIPTFPWPPPKPTSRAPLARALLAKGPASLGDVARHLEASLAKVGYAEYSYYSVPNGFALATRMEQITTLGAPRPDPLRWSTALPPQPVFSLGDYLRALFVAPQGDYRVIVFVVTDQAYATTRQAATRGDADAWLSGGSDHLPESLAHLPFTERMAGSALVYQFRKVGQDDPPTANPPDAAPAAQQLQRSGITAALKQ